MSPATFFRSSLAVPIGLPLLLLPFGMQMVVGFLLLSLAFGGVQYLIFAVGMFFAIGRRKDTDSIQKLSFLAPLLFAPIQPLGWVAWAYYQQFSSPEVSGGIWEPLLPFAVYSLAIGYLYVLIVNALFLMLRNKGLVRDGHPAR